MMIEEPVLCVGRQCSRLGLCSIQLDLYPSPKFYDSMVLLIAQLPQLSTDVSKLMIPLLAAATFRVTAGPYVTGGNMIALHAESCC